MNATCKEKGVTPYAFDNKSGDLKGFFTYDFNYHKIAYKIHSEIIVVTIVLVGSHEGFYKGLKRFIK